MSDLLLEAKDLVVNYGPVAALEGVSIEVNRGEIVALVGANGAGKSTLLKTLSGLVRPATGHITFEGTEITRTPAHRIVSAGLVHVPEGRHVFPRFTLRENLVAGAYTGDFRSAAKRADEIIASTPILARRAGSTAGQLSGGEQQWLVVERALMGNPTMIMLDEPSMGLSPVLADQILELVSQLRDRGVTVLLVEQNALGAMEIADRVYALGTGSILYSGTSAELRDNEHFADQFLGVVSADAEAAAAPNPPQEK
ncbi:ABC transporter ATP-binding protein [Aeromicrobium choanae]|uniref:Amino acid/amide ABC transporter ATP-binding protein 2, HAAT family n=1 Tax=Aeromicrobium choanae TaxID=1736691 RepID=A0A1T4YWZ6_9ACTN|nr:ABC transporter ATP-binding protein [Aeromicrobium choanae]SKB06256.1 amino acid/amide ABC transporter ATP-binding protein 2, HAAT family [Aeromicrobium choanae]